MSKSTIIYIVFANAGYFSPMLHIFRPYRPRTPCLGHLAWEILPGRSCLGPLARAHGPRPWATEQRGPWAPWAPGPRAGAHGPRQDLPGKISQARCPWQGVLGLICPNIVKYVRECLKSLEILKTEICLKSRLCWGVSKNCF